MSPTNDIGYLLNHLAFVLGRQSDQLLQRQLDIGFSQFKILMVLKAKPSIQQKQIADKLGQTEASVSRQIKWMVKDGLLNTRINTDNKREHITSLTPTGEKVTDRATQILNRYHAPTFARLSSSQQQQLVETLNIMHDAVCVDTKNSTHHVIV